MLTTQDLFEMGITSFGHRKELMVRIILCATQIVIIEYFKRHNASEG